MYYSLHNLSSLYVCICKGKGVFEVECVEARGDTCLPFVLSQQILQAHIGPEGTEGPRSQGINLEVVWWLMMWLVMWWYNPDIQDQVGESFVVPRALAR